MSDGPFEVVARVVKTHGLKGEVSVASATGASLAVLAGTPVWFVPPGPVRESLVISVRPGPKGELVKFEGVDSIDAAARIAGSEILVRRESLPDAWLDSCFTEADLVGYSVTDEIHGDLGRVSEVIITGANDVLVVHGAFGEVLIPDIPDVVKSIQHDTQSLSVRLLDGLLPGTGDEA